MLPVELLSKVMGKITVYMVSLIHPVVCHRCDWACLSCICCRSLLQNFCKL